MNDTDVLNELTKKLKQAIHSGGSDYVKRRMAEDAYYWLLSARPIKDDMTDGPERILVD